MRTLYLAALLTLSCASEAIEEAPVPRRIEQTMRGAGAKESDSLQAVKKELVPIVKQLRRNYNEMAQETLTNGLQRVIPIETAGYYNAASNAVFRTSNAVISQRSYTVVNFADYPSNYAGLTRVVYWEAELAGDTPGTYLVEARLRGYNTNQSITWSVDGSDVFNSYFIDGAALLPSSLKYVRSGKMNVVTEMPTSGAGGLVEGSACEYWVETRELTGTSIVTVSAPHFLVRYE